MKKIMFIAALGLMTAGFYMPVQNADAAHRDMQTEKQSKKKDKMKQDTMSSKENHMTDSLRDNSKMPRRRVPPVTLPDSIPTHK